MQSRMERYYNHDTTNDTTTEVSERTAKNQELYKKKDYNIYSSNETVIDTSNEVDITKIKDIIKNREDYQRARSYRNMLNDKKFDIDDVEQVEETIEEKEYDINTLLQKVKEKRDANIPDKDKVRKLKNTQYDILSKLDVKSKEKNINDETKIEDLEDLINTITHKEDLPIQKEDDNELLSDLKSEDTTVIKGADELGKDLQESLKKLEIQSQTNQQVYDRNEAERDFYSDSFTFTKRDFMGMKDLEDSVNSNNKLIKVLIFILVVVIITVGLFVADSFFDFIPFI